MKRGFTLIELMVSVAIFSIIMVISLGALLSISAADKKAETVGTVMNNLDFALESMTRNIRTGYDYHCASDSGGDCTSGGTYFKFTGPDGSNIVYRYDTTQALCGQTLGCIVRSINGGTALPITSPDVVITALTFYLRGSTLGSTGDNVQPNVVISITGYVKVSGSQQSKFNIQTGATQRLYDR